MEIPTTDPELETQQMIQQMEKMSVINEKLLIAQMSLLADDDCNTQMAVEFCSQKLKHPDQFQIKAKKISNDAASIALYQSTSAGFQSGNQKNETLLFYSGHHEHLEIIAHAGFTNEGTSDAKNEQMEKNVSFRFPLRIVRQRSLFPFDSTGNSRTKDSSV